MAAALNLPSFLRRYRGGFFALAGAVLIVGVVQVIEVALRPVALYTGTVLLSVCLALALFNGRKKIPFLPLGSAKAWLKFHLYAGWIGVVLFGCHLNWQWPRSGFNQALAGVFLVVALSGIGGWWLSRFLPPRLTASGEPLTYERITRLRMELAEETSRLAVESSAATGGSSTFADFYTRCLHGYLHAPPSWLLALRTSDADYRAAATELQALRRYMNDAERVLADRFDALIDAKRNLDFQASAQRLLKLWLFVHVPFSASLLLLAAAHVLIVLAFSGAW